MGSSRSAGGGNRGSPAKKKQDPLLSNSRGGKSSCRHVMMCLLPILGGSLILLVLVELLVKLDITIQDDSISNSLAAYEPYITVLFPVLFGASIIFVVTVARNIQIKVYFSRARTYSSFLAIVNMIAAVFNVIAYIGFIVLAVYKTGGDGVTQREQELHLYGSVIYYVFSCIYGVMHTYLTWKQTQYPLYLKLLFVALAGSVVVVTIIYGATRIFEYQWIGVFLSTVYLMLFSVLFHIDPVEDELMAFCCCGRK